MLILSKVFEFTNCYQYKFINLNHIALSLQHTNLHHQESHIGYKRRRLYSVSSFVTFISFTICSDDTSYFYLHFCNSWVFRSYDA